MKHKTFILHWLGNKTETVYGETIFDALMRAGYGVGALGALDYYEEVKEVKELKLSTEKAREISRDIYETVVSMLKKVGIESNENVALEGKVKKSFNVDIGLSVREYADGSKKLIFNLEEGDWNDVDFGKGGINNEMNGIIILE